jgi:hypothetical protein
MSQPLTRIVTMQAFICVGILVAYLVGLPYQHNTPQSIPLAGADVSWWRLMFLFGVVPAIMQVRTLLTPPPCNGEPRADSAGYPE